MNKNQEIGLSEELTLSNDISITGSKLMELLGIFSKNELREIHKFLRSPYHNQREDVVKLFEYLSSNCSLEGGNILKTLVFTSIFPGQAYDEKQLRYIMSFLFQLLKKYLTLKEIESQPLQFQLFTVKALRKRNVQRVFDLEWQATKKALSTQQYKNQDLHFQLYQLHNEQLLDAIGKSRSSTPGFSELSKELTYYFIANTLHQSCLGLSFQNIGNTQTNPELLDEVLDYIRANDLSEVPAVQIYYHCHQMLVGNEPVKNFQLLRNDILMFGDYFPKTELKDLNVIALNFCIRKVNEGNNDFKTEAFELYKAGLKKGVFIDDNQLSRFTYKNIVASGLGLNEFEWVRNFIEEYKPFLAKKYRESAYCFNLALYHFKKEDYASAMSLLQKVGTDDVLNNMNARRMLLRIYYDLNENEALHSLLDSFQTYIYRKKDLGYQRDLYLNLIKYIRKLFQVDFRNRSQVDALKQEIEATERIAEKAWLLDKLAH